MELRKEFQAFDEEVAGLLHEYLVILLSNRNTRNGCFLPGLSRL